MNPRWIHDQVRSPQNDSHSESEDGDSKGQMRSSQRGSDSDSHHAIAPSGIDADREEFDHINDDS